MPKFASTFVHWAITLPSARTSKVALRVSFCVGSLTDATIERLGPVSAGHESEHHEVLGAHFSPVACSISSCRRKGYHKEEENRYCSTHR